MNYINYYFKETQVKLATLKSKDVDSIGKILRFQVKLNKIGINDIDQYLFSNIE